MNENLSDRPATLPSRSKPQPAPGRRDPMDPAPAPAATPAAAVVSAAPMPATQPAAAARQVDAGLGIRRRRAEPLEQLNVRISSDVRDLADAASASQGITLRQVIETAIRQQWG